MKLPWKGVVVITWRLFKRGRGASQRPDGVHLKDQHQVTRSRSPRLTAAMAAHIRYLVEVKRLFQHQAAALMGVNQGRISEVMTGKRFPGVKPLQGPFPV